MGTSSQPSIVGVVIGLALTAGVIYVLCWAASKGVAAGKS